MIALQCQKCGNGFLVKKYRKDRAKFCSFECRKYSEYNQVKLVCRWCKKEFFTSESRKQIKKFCCQICYANAQRVELPSKKYKRITVNGVRYLEHRWVMEQHLGRKLSPKEHVDHINRNKHDNRIENLRVLDIRVHGSISAASRGVPVCFSQQIQGQQRWLGIAVFHASFLCGYSC